MEEKQLEKEEATLLNKSVENELVIDFVFFLRKIINIRKRIYKATGIGLVIGIIVALNIPKQYTVKVTLSPEMSNSKGNNALVGLAASFLGNEINTGNSSDALNPSLSTDIISSTPFLLELLKMKITTSKTNTDTTFRTYLDKYYTTWWSYILNTPQKIINKIKTLFNTNNKTPTINSSQNSIINLTLEDYKKINYLKKNITASIDKKTAITSISVTLQDPTITAIIADSVANKLQEYIINYKTAKAKDDCAFLEKLYIDRQEEYYASQKKYANYIDANDNLILQSIRTEQERLQNDMNLAYQVYSQVANQLQISRAKVQDEKPIFAVVEPAVIPLQSSSIGLISSISLFILLSIVFTIGWEIAGKWCLEKIKKEMKK